MISWYKTLNRIEGVGYELFGQHPSGDELFKSKREARDRSKRAEKHRV